MQSTRSLNSTVANRPVPRRRKRDIARPATETWAGNTQGAAWMKTQSLAYLRWRLHGKAKGYENSQGVVWCGYLAVFLAWCLFTLLIPHLAVLSPRYGLAPDIVTRVLLACLLPTLACMALLNAYSRLVAARAARLHDRLSLAETVGTLARWLNDGEERREILRALTELLPHTDANSNTAGIKAADDADYIHDIDDMNDMGIKDALTARTRALLLQSLRREYDREPEFALAVLRGLERWGDRAALPIVTRIVQRGSHAAVVSAANHCLATLSARFEQRRAESALLRPASDTNDILLRSVPVPPHEEAEQLLRVHDGPAPRS